MSEVLAKYLALLLKQMDYDISILTNWWVIGTVIPWVLYIIVFMVKWYALLAPVTIPLTIWTASRRDYPAKSVEAWLKKN